MCVKKRPKFSIIVLHRFRCLLGCVSYVLLCMEDVAAKRLILRFFDSRLLQLLIILFGQLRCVHTASPEANVNARILLFHQGSSLGNLRPAFQTGILGIRKMVEVPHTSGIKTYADNEGSAVRSHTKRLQKWCRLRTAANIFTTAATNTGNLATLKGQRASKNRFCKI